jgi:hypothetical protein
MRTEKSVVPFISFHHESSIFFRFFYIFCFSPSHTQFMRNVYAAKNKNNKKKMEQHEKSHE